MDKRICRCAGKRDQSGKFDLAGAEHCLFLNDATQVRQRASDVLLKEADTIRTMGRVAANLPPDLRVPLQHRLIAYSDSVLNEDWARMENGVREPSSNTTGIARTSVAAF